VAVDGLKLEIRNWEEQYKSMKAKFPISTWEWLSATIFEAGCLSHKKCFL
jgi:hypothetical protein